MNEIAKQQKALGNDIAKSLVNAKKDPIDRRTKSNIEKRRKATRLLWTSFKKNNLEAKKTGCTTHSYFTDNYYDETEQVFFELDELLSQYDLQLGDTASSPQVTEPSQQQERRQADTERLNQAKRKLATILETIRSPQYLADDQTEQELKWKLQLLSDKWEKLNEIHEFIQVNESDPHFQNVKEAKDEVDDTIRQLFTRMEQVGQRRHIHIPEANIPIFTGKYEEWATFHDLFTTVIHTKSHFSKVEKFQYLKTRLRGEPTRLIRNLTTTEANYDTAWNLLKNRYGNKRLLAYKLLDQIVNFPKIHAESAAKLKDLHDTIEDCTSAISNLGVKTSDWDTILDFLIIQKWDIVTNQLFEQSTKAPNEIPDHKTVMNFLVTRFQSLEANGNKIINNEESSTKRGCRMCKQNHKLEQCDQFKSKAVEQRKKFVMDNGICSKCLKHRSGENCYQKLTCNTCGKEGHHTLLHQALKSNQRQQQGTGNAAITSLSKEHEVLLSTAVVKVKAANDQWTELRILLDSGSQMSFISENAAQLLNLPREKIHMEVSGIGGDKAKVAKSKIWVHLQPRFPSAYNLTTEVIVLPKVTTNLPQEKTVHLQLNEWRNQFLADPTFNVPGPIDMLLGADVAGDIILGQIRKTKDGPTAQNTQFGWVLSGAIKREEILPAVGVRSMISRKEEDAQLTKFWDIEEVSQKRHLTENEKQCEIFYENTTTRDKNGIYTVRLPFKSDPDTLGQSRPRAMARLLQMERKLDRDEELNRQYKEFMEEYLRLGHMELANNEGGGKYYIPHQAVIKEDSTTTKLRIVYDASSKTSTGESLNQKMYNGPRLQEDIACILIRWRLHAVVFKADIEKMYRQILVHKDDQDYQRILWRFDRRQPIREYKLQTVTYGTTAAPYLAVKTLQRLALDEATNYPLAVKAMEDFYVDDILSGADSLEDALEVQRELNLMMKSGGFTLRKWSSNNAKMITILPQELQDQDELELDKETTKKSLGVHWNPKDDIFLFKVKIANVTPTKRNILSEIAKLYDPLGWLSPVTIRAKMLIQELWIKNLEWDQEVPIESRKQWETFCNNLKHIEKVKIPRWIHYKTQDVQMQLHGFADASEKAYGAVVYSRIIGKDETIQVKLLTSKSKVAPIKMKKTLPRLELCAAELLAKLMKYVIETLKLKNIKLYAWTDSTITLAWLRGEPSRWKNFVANRVAAINENLPSRHWSHVRSNENPADLVSRGMDPSKLLSADLWWNGPNWLVEQEDAWPSPMKIKHTDEEAKIQVHLVQTQEESIEFINRFSSYTRMIRVISYCRRFVNACRKNRNHGEVLTISEMEVALKIVVRMSQRAHMNEDIIWLENRNTVSSKSSLLSLRPFIDQDGIIRVGGRIKNASITYEEKHPMIIHRKSILATLIIRNAHMTTLHGGNQITLAFCRRRFWIIHGKQAVRHVINRCPKCIRYKGETLSNIMGNLPAARVNISTPFHHTGVDYAGPYQIRVSKGRGNKAYKGYVAIFVCLATKAVHIEVVSDMTSDAFLAAFRRLIARRGPISHVYSDNGTTFVGASKFIQEKTGLIGTQWHFIPAAAPNFGGLWESAVKSFKHHLKRVIGESTLTYEEFATLTQQIEACLNSRPLWPLTNHPEDFEALTPGHFLTGRALVSPNIPCIKEGVINANTRWRLLQKMKTDFWKTWSSEYLHNLQQRTKWKSPMVNISKDQLVLVKEDNMPPGRWPLARVTDTHPADDGTVRVVTLKQADNKIVKRPITKLILLKDSEEVQSNQKRASSSNLGIRYEKRRLGASLLMVLLSLLSMTSAEFIIKHVQPGIYVEHIGGAKINRGTFRLDVNIPKTLIHQNMENVNHAVGNLEDLCNRAANISADIQCLELIHHLKEQQHQLHWVIKEINRTTNVPLRTKRGLLGNMLTAVFGVNEEIYHDIDKLDQNQQKLIRVSTHQTKMLLSTVASTSAIEERINRTLQRFTSKLNQGLQAINAMTSWFRSDRSHLNMVVTIMEAYELADGLVQDIHDQSNRLLNLLLGRGHIYDFVNPEQVARQLGIMASRLPSTVQIWPTPVLKTTMRQNNTHIMVYGYFLISEEATYTLMKVTPTPLQISQDFYSSLELTKNFLAIEYNQQLYYELEKDEVLNCLKLDHNVFITTPTIVKSIEHNPSCAIDYLYDRKQNRACPILKHPLANIIWKQLYMANTWLFITKEENMIAITCRGHRQEVRVNTTGILHVDDDCSIKTGQSILNPVITTNIPVLSTAMKVLSLNVTTKGTQERLPDLQIATEPIIKLRGQNFAVNPDETVNDVTWSRITHHTTSTSIVTTTIGVFLLIILVWTLKTSWRRWMQYRTNQRIIQRQAGTQSDQPDEGDPSSNQFLMRAPRTSEICKESEP